MKSNRETILNGQYALNDLLDKLEKLCIKTYNEEMAKGIPPTSVLKFHLDAFMRRNTRQGARRRSPGIYQALWIVSARERPHRTAKSEAAIPGRITSPPKGIYSSLDIASAIPCDA